LEQPGAQRRAALEPVQAAYQGEPGLLRDVLGEVRAHAERGREPREPGVVALDQAREGVFVAAAQPDKQIGVAFHEA
jgi:hypothetical protein